MFLSIFTDELGVDLREGIGTLREWGYTYVDFRARIFGKAIERLSDSELRELRKLVDDNGMKVGALQTSLAKVHLPERERRSEEEQKLEGIIRAADALDCRLVRAFNYWQPLKEDRGALAEQPDKLQLVLDSYEPIVKRAREAELHFAFENCGQACEDVFALLDALDVPGWGLAWDCHNDWNDTAFRADEAEYIVSRIRRSLMLHVKARAIVPELGGALPWERILAAADASGVIGPVSVETHNPRDSGFTNTDMSRMTTEAIRKVWPTAAPTDIYAAAKGSDVRVVERSYADTPVSFVVVGLGMGHARAKTITQTPGTKLAGVCDLREDRAKHTGETFGVPFTTDLTTWLEDPSVEVVYVLTETGNHAAVAEQALEAGKHVITTKPMEARLDACDRTTQLAEKRGLFLAVDFDKRFRPETLSLRAAVREGRFGRLLGGTASVKIRRTDEYYAENGGWRGTFRLDGGGVFSNQSVHETDQIVHALGVPRRVRTEVRTLAHSIEAEDTGFALWEYDGGVLVSFHATTCFPQPTWYTRIELFGTEGACILASGGHLGAKEQLWFRDSAWTDQPPVQAESKWLNTADNMAAAIRTGAALVCDGRDGRRTQSVLDAMYRSARNGGAWNDVEAELPKTVARKPAAKVVSCSKA